ncbi:polysaccharide biosynthesis protein [Vibrio coralliirubri]|uniref:polysaccharide biosynthesis protein n=1 Tax=Vibrio coralliirubri TaxID=1516159 RepID=UPI0006365C3B|nr:polysaccharide biosynthesis protein [Vibrio coralliirubri]CDS95286.1 UDP-glucose 4-epimerase [Vibrio coralliirubri]
MQEKNMSFANKSVLITGGTGSFGSTLISDLLKTDVEQIKVLSRDEKKQEEQRFKFNDDRIKFYVGDIRDYESTNRAVKNTNYIFHAAALKQVPSCEFNPFEAVKTNIVGANNVIQSSINNEVESLVVLSTDKAVYPINTMGISKAMMEKLAVSSARECLHNNSPTKINVTRYGNVMGSRGSVIPLFLEKIKNNQPITITDPNMTRFMMTLQESVELVYHAFFNCAQGETVVKKAPSSTVLQLANVLKEMFNSSVDISYVGARHGEKQHESLCSTEEMSIANDHGDFYSIPADVRKLTTYASSTQQVVSSKCIEEYSSSNTHELTDEELKNVLLKLDIVKNYLV